MSNQYDVDKQNKVRQLRDKASYDKDKVHAILDSAQELRLGSGNGGPAICIDEFSLFRFALGAEEVGNLFGGRAAGFPYDGRAVPSTVNQRRRSGVQ